MVAKCANPSCSVSFRNLQERRLLRLEADPELTPSVNSYAGSHSRVEYFWLCSHCSEFMRYISGKMEQSLMFPSQTVPDAIPRILPSSPDTKTDS